MNKELTRIDTLDINLVDSACASKFKLDTSEERPGTKKGMGEKRLFIRSVRNPKQIDNFFELDKVKYFFFLKKDLLNYLCEARREFYYPSQHYYEDLDDYYPILCDQTNKIDQDFIKLNFRRVHDNQNRYYLVLDGPNSRNNPNRIAYSYLNNICLPRLTKIYFVKLKEKATNNLYIYMLPAYVSQPSQAIEPQNITIDTNTSVNELEDESIDIFENELREYSSRDQTKQSNYRNGLLMKMPNCAITGFSDDRILQACHIKPYKDCNEEEQFDINNGVVLTPTFHVLFERGFISFEDDGSLLISELISELNRKRLNIKERQPCNINRSSAKYLKYHREHIFKNIISSIQSYI